MKNLLNQTANIEELTDTQINDLKAGKQRLMDAAQGVFTKM